MQWFVWHLKKKEIINILRLLNRERDGKKSDNSYIVFVFNRITIAACFSNNKREKKREREREGICIIH